ncbi:hypothetical protein QBC47DRAFT_459412 [Echria macrotheca]|uniref:Cyclase n=1 Tax=Echria macrotheca TaxID=438768 RepID=A0AAJ0BEB7_9PEZI|nr:hypothetical protein QBC47DRAFT_459412 [Echria macrotheca]
MLPKTPPFEDLPLRKDGPPGNAWGLFGDNDKLGTLNRLTPENTRQAAEEIQYGIRISTDWTLSGPKTPCFKRQPFNHQICRMLPRAVNDDVLTFNTQSSTQWDGFRHYGYQTERVYFNGVKQEQFDDSAEYGIDVWVENGGIVGRGVLLDWGSWMASQGRNPDLLASTLINVSDLEAVAAAQKVQFRPGDILLIRSGLVKTLDSLSAEEVEAYMSQEPEPPIMGLEAGERMLRWLWDHEFSAVAGDMLTLEAQPFPKTHILHEWLIAGWGMPIGELFDLERLAQECKTRMKWSVYQVLKPKFRTLTLFEQVPGGIASPPNGVAIL